MEQKDTEKKILGLALNESLDFEIVIENPTLFQRIFRIKNRKYKLNKFTTLAQNIKITNLLLEIPEMRLDNKSDSELLQLNIDFVSKHTKTIVDIISYLIKEKDKEFLMRNLSNQDMFSIIVEIIPMIDFQSFMTTIALMRNKVSLKNG